MPIHVAPALVSRRQFVSSLLKVGALTAAASGTNTALHALDSKNDDHELWALLSDTHIAADTAFNARGINMAEHLRQAVEEVLHAHANRPFSGLMINGDCAYLDGQSEDYKTLGQLIKPIAEKGIPMHLTLGNHDERNRIQAGLGSVFESSRIEHGKGVAKECPKLEDKLASKIQSRFCDWYLLDSLETTNKTPGLIGEKQLTWLDASLQAAPGRPALVMVHHNPQPAASGNISGLIDSDVLVSLLSARRQVKALFFGHTHVAKILTLDGLHLVNLPACAYRFGADQPTGWTSALVGPNGCELTLFDTAKAHALHAQEIKLAWRGA